MWITVSLTDRAKHAYMQAALTCTKPSRQNKAKTPPGPSSVQLEAEVGQEPDKSVFPNTEKRRELDRAEASS